MTTETKGVKGGVLWLDDAMKKVIGGEVAGITRNRLSFLVHKPDEDPKRLIKSVEVILADLRLAAEITESDTE